MTRPNVFKALWLIAAMASLAWGLATLHVHDSEQARRVQLVLLVPNETALAHPVTQAWLDAAQEEGFALEAMTDDVFMQALANHHPIAAVVLPDTVHRSASDLLVNAIHRYTAQGGRVLVGFDAALLEPQQGLYAAQASRLSRLVGVRYALYDQLKADSITLGPVFASRETEQSLGIQPGKLDFEESPVPGWGELTTYGYQTLRYNHFKTAPDSEVHVLLKSGNEDPIVSTHDYGQGSVLFANLPLGYLKTRTDSYLLHVLLRHFFHNMALQPLLASTPQAQGGMVLNLHVDSNAAPAHLKTLEDEGWFDDGPYSIHVTAGPDSVQDGDQLGLDLPHNPWMLAFLKRQHDKGHEIGNHGGWTHNLFGINASDNNRKLLEPFLDLNQQAVSQAIGQRAETYSAPMGNQPDWATDWLRQNGFKGYYSTSDTGLGPTRSYIQGQAAPASGLWTFPISNFKRIATAEELDSDGLDEKGFNDFARGLLEHVSEQGVARLLYFHPTAMLHHAAALEHLRSSAKRLRSQGRFRWYSMADLSDFQNQRMSVKWHTDMAPDGRKKNISASSPGTLNNITWVMPTTARLAPKVLEGTAQLIQVRGQWHVIAGNSQQLRFEWQETVDSKALRPAL
jgi:peptidoglycan/xylan/chitin deacetylase (PgdA/CDA1 family)